MNKLLTDKRYSPYKGIPSMMPEIVHYYLAALGSYWDGHGCVVELGCWLGATTRALLDGLERAGYDRLYHAYDRWQATDEQVVKAEAQEVHLKTGQDLLPLFAKNATSPLLYCHQGELGTTLASYPQAPGELGSAVEICLFDAPKEDPLFTTCMSTLRPHFIPNVTVVGLLDYYFFKEHPDRPELLAPVAYMEKHGKSFKKIAEWPEQCSCVFFRYLG
jgi:hypothetical protein